MTNPKSVLVVGLDPALSDFSRPGYQPGMNSAKVLAGLKTSKDEMTRLGYQVQTCLTDFGDTAEGVLMRRLQQQPFDCIMIEAGVTTIRGNFMVFEKLIHVVQEHAPQARVCFSQLPSDTAEAVQRWI
jgi:hypothetical protein